MNVYTFYEPIGYEKKENHLSDELKYFIEDINYGYIFRIEIFKTANEIGINFELSPGEGMAEEDVIEAVDEVEKYIMYIISTKQQKYTLATFQTQDHAWGSDNFETIETTHQTLSKEEYNEHKELGFDILLTDIN